VTAAPTPSAPSAPSESGRFDLLIRGGTVVDPAQGLSGRRDVGIRAGR